MRVGWVNVPVVRMFGSGTFGSCFGICVCNQIIAVKLISKRFSKVFRHEISVMQSIPQHPNIVECFGYLIQHSLHEQEIHFFTKASWTETFLNCKHSFKQVWPFGCCFYEAILGGDLFQALSTVQNHSIFQTINVVQCLLKWWLHIGIALDHIHQHGWVHMDVKPENVLILQSGEKAMLTDFGSALRIQTEFETRKYGTRTYSPPEFETNAKWTADPSIDVFSWGKILLLIFGFVPESMYNEPWASLFEFAPHLISQHSKTRPTIQTVLSSTAANFLLQQSTLSFPGILLGNRVNK